MITKLLLHEIPSSDCRLLKLSDSSYYNPAQQVDNAILEVIPPGESCAVVFRVQKGFMITLNSSNLQILPAHSERELSCIPDGIYTIRYSVNPNDRLFVEYDLFRTTSLQNTFHREVAKLYKEKCDLSKKCFEERRTEIEWIGDLIKAAKYMAEEESELTQAVELYEEAQRLLTNLNS